MIRHIETTMREREIILRALMICALNITNATCDGDAAEALMFREEHDRLIKKIKNDEQSFSGGVYINGERV